MSFGASEWFWALVVLPLLAWLFFRGERLGRRRLREFVSPHLYAELAGSVNRAARLLKFALLLIAIGLALVALAQPRWGYTYDERKRKGLDLIFAIDTSRSMLSNDVQPNRLERVKLATQDLIEKLQGDRVGVIAFAGRAFLQAPLTIDYGAVLDSIRDLDTQTIPEGGTNISEAIRLAAQTYGKSAIGNRALVIFNEGEELKGDAVKAAKEAGDAGVRVFTVGVGTPAGSLIPIQGEDGGTAFVKDEKGQVVKSRLDEKLLRDIAEATGGFYLHLDNGPRTMQKLISGGLSKMQVGEIDARLARHPIERYEWPLGAAALALALSLLIGERKRRPSRRSVASVYDQRSNVRSAISEHAGRFALLLIFLFTGASLQAAAPGLDLYQQKKFDDAYREFQKTLQQHPNNHAADKLQFDAGAAAYRMKDYNKALESFSQALLSKEPDLQASSHYNLGNTLYERGAAEKGDDQKLNNWRDALRHYGEAIKLNPKSNAAKDNYTFVKKKIEELKKQRQQKPQQKPSPTPPPKQNQQKKNQNNEQQNQQNQNQQKQQQQKQQNQNQNQQQQPNNQPQEKSGGQGQNQQSENHSTPSPSPGESPSPNPSPSPSPGRQKSENQPSQGESPTPNPNGEQSPSASASPSPGEGGQGATPSPSPNASPQKKPSGELKSAGENKPEESPSPAEVEPVKEGEMTPEQAKRLLESLKNEEAHVQLDERKPPRHVYKDW
jgi:Ca-activated chloride channel homolog